MAHGDAVFGVNRKFLGLASAAQIKRAEGRGVDDAQDGFTVFDQRDVDGEIVVAANEFAGAVEGVDQNEATGRNVGDAAGGHFFLRDDRYAGQVS